MDLFLMNLIGFILSVGMMMGVLVLLVLYNLSVFYLCSVVLMIDYDLVLFF